MKLELTESDWCTPGIVVDNMTYEILSAMDKIKFDKEKKPYIELKIPHEYRMELAKNILLNAFTNMNHLCPRFMHDNKVTVCTIESKKCVHVGYAVVSKHDKYETCIGEAIAYLRAVGEEVPPALL